MSSDGKKKVKFERKEKKIYTKDKITPKYNNLLYSASKK